MKTHHDLEVWKKSIELVTDIYKITENFPTSENAELETQLIISLNLKFLIEEHFNNFITSLISIRKMTLGLKKSLNKV